MSGSTYETLAQLDQRLATAGHHPLTPWWQAQLKRWYEHPTARTLVARVGRGGTKSHVSAKVALTEALFGAWAVPPGERHYFAFASASKDEAAQRLALLESFLRALRVKYERSGDTIKLTSRPVGFRVFAADIAAASGFRCIGYTADELSKWASGSEYASNAVEVITSMDAMCVTHADTVRRLLVSSPFSTVDHHAERYALGDTEFQLTATAATWVANPSLSEEQTRALARHNERLWRREYAAIPDQALGSAFDGEEFEHCYGLLKGRMVQRDAICALDPSQLRGDRYVAMFAHVLEPVKGPPQQLMINNVPQTKIVDDPVGGLIVVPIMEPRIDHPIVAVTEIMSWGDSASSKMDVVDVTNELAEACKARGIKKVVSDQCLFSAIGGQLQRKGIQFKEYHWNPDSKEQAVTLLNLMARARSLSLPHHIELKREIGIVQARAMPSGRYHFDTNGRDHVSALITLAHALGDPDVLGHYERSLRLSGVSHSMNRQRHETPRY